MNLNEILDDEKILYYVITPEEWKYIYGDKEYPTKFYQNMPTTKSEKEIKNHKDFIEQLKKEEKERQFKILKIKKRIDN